MFLQFKTNVRTESNLIAFEEMDLASIENETHNLKINKASQSLNIPNYEGKCCFHFFLFSFTKKRQKRKKGNYKPVTATGLKPRTT